MATATTTTATAAAMSPLQAAEQLLGSIETWPSSIIFSLFAERPSPTVIEYLTDFFSGNNLPNTLAYRLYSACNPEAANKLVRQLFYTRFSLWHSSDTVRRHSMYYDVRLKKLVRRNVKYLPELPEEKPVPVPGLHPPPLGVKNTPTPLMVNAALQLLRREVL
jgi:hypothetical protein